MKLTQIKSDEVRTVLTAMIVHDNVLGVVHARLKGEKRPFESKWANIVCGWCRSYFEKYQKAPRKHIKSLFAKYAQKANDEETVELLGDFLSRLSKDHQAVSEELNEKYILDLASDYFERVLLQRHVEELQLALENKEVEKAKAQIAEWRSVDFSSSAWSDPFSEDTIKQTLKHYEKERGIIQWPGGLDKFLSPYFEREGFVAFTAPEKRGKSFWLLETVFQGIKQRRRVLYYVLGDMSQDQVNRRLYQRITRRPARSMEVRLPVRMQIREGQPRVEYKTDTRDKATFNEILRACDKLKQATALKELPIKMRCEGASVVSASDIEQDVRNYAQSGWVADVIVIDYADLLAPEPSSRNQEVRHQYNETWKVLRRISLDYHCLVVTATQGAATSYDAKVIRKKDFSEDKRKNAHVTGMLGINQTSEEKQLGVYRLNWVFLRDGEWTDTQVAWTAGNLAVASPCIISTLGRDEKITERNPPSRA